MATIFEAAAFELNAPDHLNDADQQFRMVSYWNRLATRSQKKASINENNRLQELIVSAAAAFFVLCIVASAIALGGWAMYAAFVEMSSWNVMELINGICGVRVA